MIVLTRINGERFAINDEQIERLEDAPNTVVVLVNGNRYLVMESLDEVIEAIVTFRSHVLNSASDLEVEGHPRGKRDSALAIFRSPPGLPEDSYSGRLEGKLPSAYQPPINPPTPSTSTPDEED